MGEDVCQKRELPLIPATTAAIAILHVQVRLLSSITHRSRALQLLQGSSGLLQVSKVFNRRPTSPPLQLWAASGRTPGEVSGPQRNWPALVELRACPLEVHTQLNKPHSALQRSSSARACHQVPAMLRHPPGSRGGGQEPNGCSALPSMTSLLSKAQSSSCKHGAA